MNSFVRVRVDDPTESIFTRFVFFFLWSNETDSFAVVNVRSSLVVNGGCSVQAESGILRRCRDIECQYVSCDHPLVRVGNESDHRHFKRSDHAPGLPTGAPADHRLLARGRWTYLPRSQLQVAVVSFEQFALSHRQLIVPSRASVVFQVSLNSPMTRRTASTSKTISMWTSRSEEVPCSAQASRSRC